MSVRYMYHTKRNVQLKQNSCNLYILILSHENKRNMEVSVYVCESVTWKGKGSDLFPVAIYG